MSDDYWDQFPTGAGYPFVKFPNIGDSVTGKIVARRRGKNDDGTPVPWFDILPRGAEDDELVTLDCGKVLLRQAMREINPQVGDEIRVTFTGTQKLGAGTAKVFEVKHKAGERPVEEAPPDEFSDEPF